MGGHRGQAQFAPPLGFERTAVTVAVVFEPQDRGAQHAPLTQVLPDPGFDGAQVFADHHRAGPVCLQRHDPDHRVVVVAHVGALRGRGALGDPPQPEEPDDVVDAHPAGVPQNRLNQLPKRLIAELFEPIGSPWRLRPVLAELIELVRRRPGGDAERQHILHGPGVGAGGMDPDREVVNDSQRHAGAQRLGLGFGQLIVELPLHPAVEVDELAVLFDEVGDSRGVRIAEGGGPLPPVVAVLLGQRAPGRELLQRLALAFGETGEGQFPARGPGHPVDPLECLALGRPDRVAIYRPRRGQRFPEPADDTACGDERELRYRLDAQIKGVDEAPRRRQVGRGFHGFGRRSGMQRIHQQVAGPVPGPRPHREVGQIDQITQTPRAGGVHAVDLHGQPPEPLHAHPRRQTQPGRGDDEPGDGLVRSRAQVHPVVAQRQICGQHEGRLADQAPVELERCGEVVRLPNARSHPAVLEAHPHMRGCAVVDVHPEGGLRAAARDYRGRQRTRPVPDVERGMRCGAISVGPGGHTQGRQHSHHRLVADRHRAARPVVVLGGHPHPMGESCQRRLDHGCHLARSVRSAPDNRGALHSADPDSSIVRTPAMIRAIPRIISLVSGSANSTRASRATRATPQADHTP